MIFSESAPRVFGLPPGVDFPLALARGLEKRLSTIAPELWPRVTIYMSTARMQRRLRALFDQGPARLLPRIRLISDLALDPVGADLPLPVPPLQRRLELTQLVSRLLEAQPDLAPRSALFDLSDSLADLMDEMQGEGVTPDTIRALDVSDQSGHWQRSLSFLSIIQGYFDQSEAPDKEARQRMVIERLVQNWEANPPQDPIIVAGSTGSRGATQMLMRAVAKLPQGAVVLPGFDFDMPPAAWEATAEALTAEDHPQYRFRKLTDGLGLTPADVQLWSREAPPDAARNKLISLSLRPAPVTDQWRLEGPHLGNLLAATEKITLLEAPSPRLEAETIALRLRHAIDEGRTAALITPDRMLTRQVAATLDRWGVTPDDSAGQPLPLSPPGRLLRQVCRLFGQVLTAEDLLALLKHPLAHSGEGRGPHLLHTHDLEKYIRAKGMPFPDAASLHSWAGETGDRFPDRLAWTDWVIAAFTGFAKAEERPLHTHLTRLIEATEAIARGQDAEGSGGLWDEAAGRKARAVIDNLALHASHAGEMMPRDFTSILDGVLASAEVRDRDAGHPQVLIWGTLEARVQGADLVILAGLNEGSWPQSHTPDPWLNRALRARAGLLLPERRIGLSAHDYQQAIASEEVWITRALRSSDAETVATRWVNRLTNLLEGLPAQQGDKALAAMRARAEGWLAQAVVLAAPEETQPKAARPSPRPPLAARPKQLSVTRIETLLRNPYEIYASRILRLDALGPLTQSADALIRGTVIHRIFEDFTQSKIAPDDPAAKSTLLAIADQVLAEDCPWPVVARQWRAQIARVADWFLQTETVRRSLGTPHLMEQKGTVHLGTPDFTLTGKADRIDLASDGRALIYDYKTGAPPSAAEQAHFSKQLLIETAMVEQGAFEALGKPQVAGARFIGLGSTPKEVDAPLDDNPPSKIWDELQQLICAWEEYDRGYTARISPKSIKYDSDYDHLSRLGEWEESDVPTPEDLA